MLLMVARPAAPRVTLSGARPELSKESRAAWLALLVSERALLETRLERSRARLVQQQASRRARQLRQEQPRRALRPALRRRAWLMRPLLRAPASRTGSARPARACGPASR